MARVPAIGLSVAVAFLLPTGNAAAQELRSFNLRAESAVKSLPEFARQAGIQILAPTDDLEGIVLPQITGTYDVRAALDLLLAQTGLMIASDMGGVIVLRAADRDGSESRRADGRGAATPDMQPVRTAARFALMSASDELTITGSRITRPDYEVPTPVMMIGAEALAQQMATTNVADMLNTLPHFAGSIYPAREAIFPSAGTGGLNALNLRNLGLSRTLVLLDGRRSVPVLTTGIVDVNSFPQQLISRVDVVTGGASAVYGSDAVGGVVNFILDKKFTGMRGEASMGVTSYGDDFNWKVSLAGGFPFSNGRGHILISGETVDKDGIINGTGGRTWASSAIGLINNPDYTPANGQPEIVTRDEVFLSKATHGGLIFDGPLKGTAFGPGGVPYQFNFGVGTDGDQYMSGGDWRSTLTRDRLTLDPSETRHNLFFRTAYDVTDNLNVFLDTSWSSSHDAHSAFPHYQAGSGPVILAGNPFIPVSVRQRMAAAGLSSFQIGSMNYDMPAVGANSTRVTNRYVAGATGALRLFDGEWIWNAYVLFGATRNSFNATNVENKNNYALAVDAVVDPVTGAVVCRSTLANPANGCVPWNPLGTGVNSDAARRYILGTGHVNQRLRQTVYALSFASEPIETWAGPLSMVFTAERRTEGATAVSGPVEQAGLWRAGNYQPIDARYYVTEGAIEGVIPLAVNTRFADRWDVTAVFRGTDYQSSGYVSAWKIGSTYAPDSSVKFRVTRSRDIRAPNLDELYQTSHLGQSTAHDPFTNTTPTFTRRQIGNPHLKPEKADTTSLGIVVQPQFLPGFSASIDYWSIDIDDAISPIEARTALVLCFQGRHEFCDSIQRVNGVVVGITQSSFNFTTQKTRGVDFEGSYQIAASDIVEAWTGKFAVAVNATVYLKNYINNGIGAPVDNVGENFEGAAPHWVMTSTFSYHGPQTTASLTARAFSAGTHDNSFIECTANCPPSTPDHPTIDNNRLPGALYFDASLSYRFSYDSDVRMEAFFNVRNLLNTGPGLTPRRGNEFGYIHFPSNLESRYDKLGRIFRGGVRIAL